MSIILNEYEWARGAISNRSLGTNPYDTLVLVAKYYTENGHNKKEVRQYVERFMLSCEPEISMYKWDDTIDKAVKLAAKYPPIQLEAIKITNPEMDKIDSLPAVQLQRLAFTLLCVSKYMDIAHIDNNHWVNTPDKDIMRMANIKTSTKRQCLMFGELRNAGMIEFSKKIDNLNVKVVFAEPGETVMEVRDFRNLGYQYMKYHGGPFYECACCGIISKMRDGGVGRPRKYCPSCAAEIQTKRMVNNTMRRPNNLLN